MQNPSTVIKNLIKSDNIRSQKIKSNILYSFGIKGVSILTTFIMVPVTLKYLGTSDYGIWLTMSSIVAWFGFFDIGIGNGLRNKFTEAVSLGNAKYARTLVSTAYVGLTAIMIALWLIFFIISSLIDWSFILKVPAGKSYNVDALILFIFSLFAIRMVLKLISVILIADQKAALSNIFDPLSNIISLIAILILASTTSGSLSNFIIAVSLAPLIILTIATLYFFRSDYKAYRPSIKHVNISHIKDLTGLGFKFFIIQISVLIIFSTDNLIITRIIGPQEVTTYNIAYKYFNILIMIFSIIMTPMWAAYTQAYVLNDLSWIKNINKKLIKVWFMIVMSAILFIAFANWFYHLWVGDKIIVPLALTTLMGIFVIISTWNNIFVYFINSTGKIKLQLYSSLISASFNIPISIFLARNLNMGSAGVILGTCICLAPGIILGPLQYRKILNKTDKGIWSK